MKESRPDIGIARAPKVSRELRDRHNHQKEREGRAIMEHVRTGDLIQVAMTFGIFIGHFKKSKGNKQRSFRIGHTRLNYRSVERVIVLQKVRNPE